MNLRRQLLLLSLSFVLAVPPTQGQVAPITSAAPFADSEVARNAPPLVIVDDAKGATLAFQEFESVPASRVSDVLGSLPSNTGTVVVSTDNAEVLEQAAAWSQQQDENHQAKLITYGDQVLKPRYTNRVQRTLGRITRSTGSAVRGDPIGMMITVVTTSYDSMIWIHSQTGSIEQKTAMIFMNVLLAASFGLDKDLWARATRPISRSLDGLFSKFQLISGSERAKAATKVASKFFANVSLSVAIQLTRMSLFSIDSLAQSMASPKFWTTSFLLGTLLTVSSFGWSEGLSDVDEVRHPVAKFALRRGMELRGLILSYTSPSSKILQTDVYGITPLVILMVNGAAGIAAWTGAERLIPWLERRPLLRFAYDRTARASTAFQRTVQRVLLSGSPRALAIRCDSILAM